MTQRWPITDYRPHLFHSAARLGLWWETRLCSVSLASVATAAFSSLSSTTWQTSHNPLKPLLFLRRRPAADTRRPRCLHHSIPLHTYARTLRITDRDDDTLAHDTSIVDCRVLLACMTISYFNFSMKIISAHWSCGCFVTELWNFTLLKVNSVLNIDTRVEI